jgi:Cu/Ag efflux pump CusA
VIKSFLTGAIAGAAVMWLWGEQIRDAVDEATSGVRTRTADQLQGVAEKLQSVAETVDQGLSGTTTHQPRVS